MSTRGSNARRPRGFTYLGVLFIVGLLATTAAAAGVVWAAAQQRDNEVELVFVGRQFAAAIERYRAASGPPTADPTGDPSAGSSARSSAGSSFAPRANPTALYPRSLEALLRDDRAITPQHHLRRLYLDPMTGNAQWGLIRLPGGGIVGVHSLSDRQPFPRQFVVAGFSPPPPPAHGTLTYRDWHFVAPSAEALLAPQPGQAPPPVSGSPSPTGPAASPPPDGSTATSDEPTSPTRTAVPRPTLQDLRSQTPEACSRIAAYDEEVCARQGERFGDDAARDCRDSAVRRSVACAVGDKTPLTPLNTRQR